MDFKEMFIDMKASKVNEATKPKLTLRNMDYPDEDVFGRPVNTSRSDFLEVAWGIYSGETLICDMMCTKEEGKPMKLHIVLSDDSEATLKTREAVSKFFKKNEVELIKLSEKAFASFLSKIPK